MPEAVSAMLETHLSAITWPAENLHLLTALDPDTGLFSSPQGNTYAHIADEGHFQVEHQADGRYRIFWPATLGEPGPFVTRVEGQPHWRTIGPPRPKARADRGNQPATDVSAVPPQWPSPVPEVQAGWLSKAQDSSDGIRYDKLGSMYVDMDDGATFLVRKREDGSYQLASRHERNLLVVPVEQIPGSNVWRKQPTQPIEALPRDQPPPIDEPGELSPGPSKRARLVEDRDPSLLQPPPNDSDQGKPATGEPSTGDWRNWGKTLPPQWSDSIEIEGQHYAIVPQRVEAATRLVYLENPLFKPDRFDAFEQMLSTTPALQPKRAIKSAGEWTVVETRPFAAPLTQCVARSFLFLSDQSSSAIATAVFNRANGSDVINGDGLRVVFETLYHWENRNTSRPPARDLADPLMMLPVVTAQLNADLLGHTLSIPSRLAPALQRIDFDTSRLNRQLNAALNSPGTSLRSVFSDILRLNGYEVDRTSRVFSEDTLLFKRPGLDAVFVLRFRSANSDGTLHRQLDPDAELTVPAFRNRVARSNWKDLLDPGKVIFLVGGMQKHSAEHASLFIIREG